MTTDTYDVATGNVGHVWDRDAGTARGLRTLQRELARALRDAGTAHAARHGYRLLADVIGVGVGSPVVDIVTRVADDVAQNYYVSDAVASVTLERLAVYLDGTSCLKCADDDGHAARHELARARIADDDGTRYAANFARRIAVGIVRRSGTGRGSMPTFTRTDDDIERMVTLSLRKAIGVGPVAAWTLADENGHRRAMTDTERDTAINTLRVERVERSPLYAPLLDGHGQPLPSVRNGHGTGHTAPNVPERDAAPLRVGTVAERLAVVAAPTYIRDTVTRIYDTVNTPWKTGRYRKTAPWQTLAEALPVSETTLKRHVRNAVADVTAYRTTGR